MEKENQTRVEATEKSTSLAIPEETKNANNAEDAKKQIEQTCINMFNASMGEKAPPTSISLQVLKMISPKPGNMRKAVATLS